MKLEEEKSMNQTNTEFLDLKIITFQFYYFYAVGHLKIKLSGMEL